MKDISNFDWGWMNEGVVSSDGNGYVTHIHSDGQEELLNEYHKTSLTNEIFEWRIYEKFFEVEPNDIVLDIGAHVGSFSIAFGSCVGENGKVLAFEPNPITFDVLKQHAEANPKFNIEPYNLACTHEDGNFKFHYSDSNIYGAGTNGGYFNGIENGDKIKRFHSEEIDVIGVNVCDFVNKMGQDVVDKIKFIKSDTEGFDKEVLKTS